jgi:DNA-binding transcriptional MerR regulator
MEGVMSTVAPPVPTVGEIARRLGVPVHRVVYVIESRGIRPAGRAGTARIFSEADVAYIASELRRIKEDKAQGGGW